MPLHSMNPVSTARPSLYWNTHWKNFPGNEQVVSALASYYQQQGNMEKLQWLMEAYPN